MKTKQIPTESELIAAGWRPAGFLYSPPGGNGGSYYYSWCEAVRLHWSGAFREVRP